MHGREIHPPDGSEFGPPPPALDLLLGLGFVAIAVGLWLGSEGLRPMIPGTAVGPALMPRICAGVFAVFGAVLAFSALRRLVATGAARPRVASIARPRVALPAGAPFALIVPGILVGVIFAMPRLGFVPTVFVAGAGLMRLGGARWPGALVAAAALTGVIYVTFSWMMRVPLPRVPFL